MIITLDGPCGSGKSTLAQLLAQKLGFFYINSGYLYRSLAYILVTEFFYDNEKLQHPNFDDVALILDPSNYVYQYSDGVAQVFFRGREITQYLKSSQVSRDASIISAHEKVRNIVVPLQQQFGKIYNIVTDGRDGGTEIYPHAQFKFYITATIDIRAQRLQDDLERSDVFITLQEAVQMIQSRDMRDTNRAISPLRKADNAIEIDTSFQSVHQVLDFIVSIVSL